MRNCSKIGQKSFNISKIISKKNVSKIYKQTIIYNLSKNYSKVTSKIIRMLFSKK